MRNTQFDRERLREIFKRSGWPILITLGIWLALLLTAPAWETLELKGYDFRVRALDSMGAKRGSSTNTAVVVGMEEDTMVKVKPLIFWYPELGALITRMSEYGAKAVAIDLIPIHSLGEKMTESMRSVMGNELDPSTDSAIATVGERADTSLMGAMLAASSTTTIVQGVADGTVPYYYPLMAFMQNVHPASVRLVPDKDNIVRRQQLIFNTEDGMLDSFTHALLKTARPEGHISNRVTLNYSIRKDIPYYSFSDVLDGRYGPAEFKDKMVLLGYITLYDDVHAVPLGYQMQGVMIHAVALETMLGRSWAVDAPFWLSALVLALLCAGGLWLSLKQGPVAGLAGVLVLTAGFALLDTAIFHWGLILKLFPHTLAPVIVFAFVYPYRYLVAERHSRKVYRTFSYYMDRKVIDTLIEQDAESLLKGESKELCIMFSDIRGFTALTERCRPDSVVAFMNVYFARMTEIIHRHGGVVDKFVGDAVLAYFHSNENPASSALNAAREMLAESERINTDPGIIGPLGTWKLKMGIGIHHGSVIMGNIGSEMMMDFTIIGEPVNTASRIEFMTKQLGQPVLTTQAVYDMAHKDFVFKHMGRHEIRGLQMPIDIYTVLF